MISQLRQGKRISGSIPIEVTAQNKVSGKTVAGPFSGKIINISNIGSCLLVGQVMRGSYHIFHSTREDDSLFLQLTITLTPEIENFTIPARPIWMNIFHHDDIRTFKIGMEFLLNSKEEQRKVKKLLATVAQK